MIHSYDKYFSKVARSRKPSPLHSLIPLTQLPNMISLAGGLPNNQGFPFSSCSFKLKDGTQIAVDEKDMRVALQYAPSEGYGPLVDWLFEHQVQRHKIDQLPQEQMIILTTGSQDALTRAFELLLDVFDEECISRDAILVENPTYSGALAALVPMGVDLIEIPIDEHGIIPEQMENILIQKQQVNTRIKCLYTIPTGQNPSGATQTNKRKREIYELARRFDFIILEDDPYYYLTLDELEEPIESYLSMDVDGRVIRFDSMSKVLSSGIRVGWCTGPKALLTPMHYHMQGSCLHASCISQAMVYSLFNSWGISGLDEHVKQIQTFYRTKRDELIESVEKNLKGLVTYNIPSAGMFLWISLNDVDDTSRLIQEQAREAKVLMVPGQAFIPSNTKTSYFRASFSSESRENMDLAMQRIASLIYK